MHFRHILAKIQPRNLKHHFDWGPWTFRFDWEFLTKMTKNENFWIKKTKKR